MTAYINRDFTDEELAQFPVINFQREIATLAIRKLRKQGSRYPLHEYGFYFDEDTHATVWGHIPTALR